MIDVQVRIHDRFSVEFKIGYMVHKELKINDFVMNTWVFVPNSLDINSFTYTKNQFYRNVKSNIRLITPIYTVNELADEDALPFRFLEVAINELMADPTRENLAEVEYQIKMFCSIVKSAMRRGADQILKNTSRDKRESKVWEYRDRVIRVIRRYRNLKTLLSNSELGSEALVYYLFGDEFLSNLLEFQIYRLLELMKQKDVGCYQKIEEEMIQVVKQEIEYKQASGYGYVRKDSPDCNRAVFFRMRLLKKYVESHLFLNAYKKKDGQIAEQVYFSVAAGISMIFATAIAFSFQQKYGNFTMPLFVALVISYMLKDRIKELTRYYFVHRLAKKYFDNKTIISIKETPLGWIKEGVDFITENRVPEEIMEMRGRSDLLEANNRSTAENIILYRKLVQIDSQVLDENNQYDVAGVNDILSFNVSGFVLKMDNPEVPLAVPSEDGGYEIINGERIYYVNFLIQLRYDDNIDYKRFRLIMSRDGIQGIEKL